ncbi:MAG: MlaD family protein [Candidatus Omnitrophota bacterium]|nr:MlaD family protein [Candidatus Omnitrophota bacterium]
MTQRTRIEAKVGIFVFVALVILVYFVTKIGDIRLLSTGYNLKVFFGFANGLKVNSPVRVAGVDAGEVKKINVYFDPQTKKTRVEIAFWVKKDTQIPRDSEVMINTLGLLGEKYLEVIPGSDYTTLFKDGDVLLGDDPVSMEEIGNLGRRIATKLEESIDSLNKVIKDEELRLSLKQAVSNLNQVGQELNTVLDKINKGEGMIGKLIYDDSLYQDLDSFVNDLKAHPWKLLFRPKEESGK